MTVGAVSNWVWNLPELLHSLDLVRHFDFIAASARIGFEKPHPEDLRVGPRAGGRRAGAVIHVGDHVDADVEGARASGSWRPHRPRRPLSRAMRFQTACP